MDIRLDPIRNWCYAQWKPLLHPNNACELATRVVTAPLLAIATLSAEVLIPLRWTFHYLSYSREDRLQKEFNILEAHDEPEDPSHYRVARENAYRNRYSNVLPNEPTRVQFGEEGYFNANWVLGKKAIACQGPISTEIKEFWEMVDETGVETIVSLANIIESGRPKCSDFWSAYQTREETLFVNGNEKIVRRECQSPKGKTIVQYHLQNWPDHGVVDPETLAELVRIVSKREGKMLVHCSAGIGRTGTFLSTYEAFQTKSWNIFRIAKALRSPWTGRVGMIQASKQYILAHNTLQELFNHSKEKVT